MNSFFSNVCTYIRRGLSRIYLISNCFLGRFFVLILWAIPRNDDGCFRTHLLQTFVASLGVGYIFSTLTLQGSFNIIEMINVYWYTFVRTYLVRNIVEALWFPASQHIVDF